MKISATSLIGMDVHNGDGQSLGEIEDIMLDAGTGKVNYAVLSFGGLLGIGDKYFAVPLQLLQLNTAGTDCVLNEPQERLINAPGFDKNNWPDDIDGAWLDIVRRYYELSKTD